MSKERKIDLTHYHEAMVFLNYGANEIDYTMCNILYMKQLLVCENIQLPDEDSFNVPQIKGLFESVSKFKSLSKKFDEASEVGDMCAVADALFDKLCSYVGEDETCYEPSDVSMYERALKSGMIKEAQSQCSKEVIQFVEESGKSISSLIRSCLNVQDILTCRKYADLLNKIGKECRIDSAVTYSPTFKKWCQLHSIRDMAAEKEQLMKRFNVDTDEFLDKYLELNMV